MENLLFVTSLSQNLDEITAVVAKSQFAKIITAKNGGLARRKLIDDYYDLVIVNSPLEDESGINLARNIANRGIFVILLVKGEIYEEVASTVEADGVFTIAKPVDSFLLRNTIKLSEIHSSKLRQYEKENRRLQKQVQTIKSVGRAKCILMERENLSEEDAHKKIEKIAMNSRKPKRQIAEEILRKYQKE